jgi:phenylacetaldehyde dehydrogenase
MFGDSFRLPNGSGHAFTVREPVGVAGLIVPWNYPLQVAVTKLAAALAAGCTTVLKPAEQTPLSCLYLGRLIIEAGFPKGVVNIVTGDGSTGAALAAHEEVDKISFTGSTEVGRKIVAASAGNFKRVTLELGGKSPIVIFPDADIDQAIEGAAFGIFQTSGQVCGASSRLYAHEKVFDRVVEGVAQKARELKVGPGLDPDTEMGPLVSAEQLAKVTGLIESGLSEGAEAVTGGGQIHRAGYFVEPTVLVRPRPEMRIMQEEIFGPVLASSSFSEDDIDQVAAEANNSTYGLVAYVWTRDLGTAHKMASKLKAGCISINGGWAEGLAIGGFKQSGWGREIGREGIEAFLEVKSVGIAY